ncbi:helix-turn-helix domain-containing protein [Streptomyces sp. NPDC050658]|uniref:AraC family transcriptional regulator n=1 Tax=unclassified Streptomyces TaxID=2593676 RepID=UPI0034390032
MCHPAWAHARITAQRLTDLARLRRVRDRIDREYMRPLDVAALARDANMPAAHLGRAFQQAYGQSPYAYLTARRNERANTLLHHAASAASAPSLTEPEPAPAPAPATTPATTPIRIREAPAMESQLAC